MLEHIDAVTDPRVADYRDVREPELVRGRGLFVAEGRLVVRRLIEEDGRFAIRSVLVNEASATSLDAVLAALPDRVPVYVCSADRMRGIAGYDVHRGCLALVDRPRPSPPADLIAAARTLVVLEGVTNADNVGGVFRNAAAFGVEAVLLSPTCCDPLYRKAIRTSMAATLRVPFARVDDWPGGLSFVRRSGFAMVALTPRALSEDLAVFAARPRPAKVALVLGTEGEGLSPVVEATADHQVRIPIAPGVDSLNVAVASGIALYALAAREP